MDAPSRVLGERLDDHGLHHITTGGGGDGRAKRSTASTFSLGVLTRALIAGSTAKEEAREVRRRRWRGNAQRSLAREQLGRVPMHSPGGRLREVPQDPREGFR